MKIREYDLNAISLHSLGVVESIVGLGILVSVALVISYCLWTLDLGFEITDEAYYLLLAKHADSVKFYISAQQWLTAGIWSITGNISLFRASGMALLLASSSLLGLGVFSVCHRLDLLPDRFLTKTVVVAGSVAGAMLYASTINFSPCYNLLASTGAYAAAGLTLLALNCKTTFHKLVLLALAGCAVGTELLSKPSAGVATFTLLVFWCSILDRPRATKIYGSLSLVFGATTFGCLILLANTTFGEATQVVDQSMQLFRMVQVETIGDRLLRYAIEFGKYFLAILFVFLVPIAGVIGYISTRRAFLALVGMVALLFTLIFGSLSAGLPTFSIQNATIDSYLFGGFNRYSIQTVAIFAMLFMVLIISIPVWNKTRDTQALFLGLLLLPYSVAIGTGNVLFTQVIVSLAPWGAVVAILMVADHPASLNKLFTVLIGACFISTISLQIVTSQLRPYHLSQPLTKQDQVTTVEGIGTIKVDAGTYRFLDQLNAAAKGCAIGPGTPFIGLYNIPGVALTLQATPVMTPWLNNKEQAEFVLKQVKQEDLRSAVVAIQMRSNDAYPELPQQLAGFPRGYRYCGLVTYPYMKQRIQIWKSQTR